MKKGAIGILSGLVGVGVGSAITGKKINKKVDNWKKMSDKHLDLFKMMNRWVNVKQEGKNLSEYFEKNNYKNIAIYGMNFAGETLINELKGTETVVKYGIDKNADRIYSEVDIVTMENMLEEVDVVVVTAITFYNEIKEKLEEKINCPIISLEDILCEI